MGTVFIDPGHGGEDPGCEFGPLQEAALVYQVADLLTGFEKRLSRGPDEKPTFKERAARSEGCEAALVLHFNSGEVRFSKPEIYYKGPAAPLWWLGVVPGNHGQTLTHNWEYPIILGRRVAFFDTSLFDRKGWPAHLSWLQRAENCVERYQIPTILLEIGYLSDPRVQDYIKDRGVGDIAYTLSNWIIARQKANQSGFEGVR